MSCCDGTCFTWPENKCCDDIGGSGDGYKCHSGEECCDGDCVNTVTEKCCDDGVGPDSDYECDLTQCCNEGECVDENDMCDTCEVCQEGSCDSCKCWDVGSELSGSVSGSDAVLCQGVTHTSSISDTDHWIDGNSNEGTPSDTIGSYNWSATAGTFTPTPPPNQANAAWQAPPCTGNVTINLNNTDDTPDAMYDECPEPPGTRDDAPKSFNDTVNVSLPSGCTTGSKSANLSTTKVSTPSCSGSCGLTSFPSPITKNIEAKYNSCKWVFQVTASGDTPCRPCPSYFTEISGGTDADLTSGNYCGIVTGFRGNGCISVGGTVYSKASCVQIHEDKHYSLFNDYLISTSTTWLLGRNSMSDITIDCSDLTTISCQAAISSHQSSIAADIQMAYSNAWNHLPPAEEEARCVAAAASCFNAVADSICATWDPTGANCSDCP